MLDVSKNSNARGMKGIPENPPSLLWEDVIATSSPLSSRSLVGVYLEIEIGPGRILWVGGWGLPSKRFPSFCLNNRPDNCCDLDLLKNKIYRTTWYRGPYALLSRRWHGTLVYYTL